MIGYLRSRWFYTWSDVWEPLSVFSETPPDLFIQLYSTAADFFQRRPNYKDYEQIVNDPEKAQEEFRKIQGKDFKSETFVVEFFEHAYKTIDDFGISGYVDLYSQLIRDFLERYNLRYIVVNPFRLRVQLPGAFADIYHLLKEINHESSHLTELMSDFEDAYSSFVLTQSDRDLKTCLAKASNYAEGVAAFSLNKPSGVLSRLCEELAVWPHASVKESLKPLYTFCSDYPSIRHAGTPSKKLRELDSKDTVIISLLLIAFSGYLNTQVTANDILESS